MCVIWVSGRKQENVLNSLAVFDMDNYTIMLKELEGQKEELIVTLNEQNKSTVKI